MDSSVGMMPLFSTGTVLSNMGSGAAGERLPGLVEPMVSAPTVRGGLSRAEGPIHSSDRGLLYRYVIFLLVTLFSTERKLFQPNRVIIKQ
jgi:hypothetical protein